MTELQMLTLSSKKVQNTVKPVNHEPIIDETDEQIIARIKRKFNVLVNMTKAIKRGDLRSMIVSGSVGVGKSFEIERELKKHEEYAKLSDSEIPYLILKGRISDLVLYKTLYEYRHAKNVIVFDDMNTMLYDNKCLELLMGALDTGAVRRISWNTESRVLAEEDIPRTFDFEGGVIFLTNLKFTGVRSNVLAEQLAALRSRCHFIDIGIRNVREKMLRIKQSIDDGMLDHYHFSDAEQEEIFNFIDVNKDKLDELSMRTVIKAANLKKAFRNEWEDCARATLFK